MDWWQLAIAVVASGGFPAIVNAIANRHSVTADVYESISQSAATLAKTSAEQVGELFKRVHELEEREKAQTQELIALRSEVRQLQSEVSGKETKIAAQAEEIAKLKAELSEKEAEIERLRERVRMLEDRLSYGRQSYDPRYTLRGEK